ncbi:MAG: PKD domain-containing protein [Thermovirgaceae bacterium]|jgi:hypothetical protein
MRLIHALVALCLVSALVVAPASAADDETGGILQGITDFFFWWLPESEEPPVVEDPPVAEPDLGIGMQILALDGSDTDVESTGEGTEADPTVTPTGTEPTVTPTPEPRVLGTVYAVDYQTNPIYGSAPLMVRFTANESEEIDTYAWDFGDGFSHTDRDNFHSYMEAGVYTATLTVSNSTTGWNTSAEMTITVEPPGVVPLPEDDWMF